MIATDLCLAGHDSELYSFLDSAFVEQLRRHPSAEVPLWTFGTLEDERLASVPMWNRYAAASCLAWTSVPAARREGKWWNYGGLTTDDDLYQVHAIVLIRHLFVQGYTCGLDDRWWIDMPADLTLERLPYIRGYAGKSTESPEWMDLQAKYFDWALEALEHLLKRGHVAEQVSQDH